MSTLSNQLSRLYTLRVGRLGRFDYLVGFEYLGCVLDMGGVLGRWGGGC